MRKRTKSDINSLEKKISELEQEIANLKKQKKNEINYVKDTLDNAIALFASTEELDFLYLDIETHTFKCLATNDTGFVIKAETAKNKFDNLIAEEDRILYYNALGSLTEKPYVKIQAKVNPEPENSKDFKPVEISLINIKKDTKQVLLVLKDISKDLKQKKDLIRSKEKIEESDKLKTTILSNISHYIRTPLNSVTGFSELLAGSDLEYDKRQEYIDIIKRQSKRILSLIDDLSEIAKLESGNISISNNPCNLNLILNEIHIGINQQRTLAQRELVNVELDTPEGKGLELITDSGRLQQVISNLVNYSLRYTQKGKIQIGYRLDEALQKVIFFVKDTSSGLSKDEQKSIFNKFSVLDSSESNKYEDPGLGLTIAKNIIKNLGGKIWIESEEGKGNEFFFTLPYEQVNYTRSTNIEEEFTRERLYHWPNKVILIVDDEEINTKFIDAVLQGTSAQILYAKNGQEAIELCKSINKIDLILMDIKMPVMNGIKATSEIRKFNRTIPIIAQTALTSEEDKQKCLQAGCSDIITKPIEVQELLYKVNKYLAD